MVSLYDIYTAIIKRNVFMLKESGLRVDERTYLLIILLILMIPIILKLILNLNFKSSLILFVMYFFSALMIPKILYESKIEKFERNLPKALYVMVLALESGRSVIDAINNVIESDIKEVSIVFLKVMTLITDKKLSFEDAILLVSNSIDSKIFRQIGRLLIENRKYGGELAEVLKTLAKTLEDLQNLKFQLLSVTANGLAVGLIIICGVVPATAGIIGGYMNTIASLVPNTPPVTPEQISKCMEYIQIGTGLFGLLFAIPLYGLKINRMVVISTICMSIGMMAFYTAIKLVNLLFT